MTPVPINELNPLEFGLVGALLLLIWKLLDVAKTLFLNKQQPALAHAHRRQDDSSLDPLHIQRTEEIHERLVGGHLGCHWKDREEVRDFIEAMRGQTTASKAQTQAINGLVDEMRRTRNGGAK